MVGIDKQHADRFSWILARLMIGSANQWCYTILMTGLFDSLAELGVGAAAKTGDRWVGLPVLHRSFECVDGVNMTGISLSACRRKIARGQSGP